MAILHVLKPRMHNPLKMLSARNALMLPQRLQAEVKPSKLMEHIVLTNYR